MNTPKNWVDEVNEMTEENLTQILKLAQLLMLTKKPSWVAKELKQIAKEQQ